MDRPSTIRQVIFNNKIAPRKQKQTIPLKELEGATIGAQSAKGVLDDLSIDTSNPSVSQVFWMDLFSMLWWIWSEKSLVTYCHDTVEKIRQNIFRGQWRLVPTEQNPADTICRGTKTVNKFLGSDLWFHGRRFLYLSRDV